MTETPPDRPNYPVVHEDLIDRAKATETPVAVTEDKRHRVICRAAQEADGVVWLAKIEHSERADGAPSVGFQRCHIGADHNSLRKWSSVATGRLSGPQRLPAWERLFTVFSAALHEYNREVCARD